MSLFNIPLKVIFPSLLHHLPTLLCLIYAGSHITCLNDSAQSPSRITLFLQYMSNNMGPTIHDPFAHCSFISAQHRRRPRNTGRAFFFFFTKARIWMMDGWQGDLPLGRHHITRVECRALQGVKKKLQRQTLLLLGCTCQFDSGPEGFPHSYGK